jgi:iron complex outermembrane receptor protein
MLYSGSDLHLFMRIIAATALSLASLSSAADDGLVAQADMIEIEIKGGTEGVLGIYTVDVERTPDTTPDTAAVLKRAPGANANRNGPLTGIAQYRGMYGHRINALVDGMQINSGGPNGMDPPLSYIPRARLGSLDIIRGIAPVSSGIETIGGTMVAKSKHGDFATGTELSPQIDVTTGGASADSSSFFDAMGTLASRQHRLDIYGTRERGSNYKFGNGKVKPSRFERNNVGTGYGYRTGAHEFSLEVRRNETDPTGTPSLPMDIIDINTTLTKGEYRGKLLGHAVHGKLYWSDVNHKMSNYELRQPPMNMTRLNNASSNGIGYRLDADFTFAGGTLLVGADGHLGNHDSIVVDPVNNTGFRVDNFNDVDRNLYGVFTEWNSMLAGDWELYLGLRYNRVDMDAGQVSSTIMMANALQNRFNAANRSKTDNNIDLLARLAYVITSGFKVQAEAGRKTRSPSYQERYLWLPIEATNGLADGNVYVGDIDLDPEVAYEVGLGIDWQSTQFHIEPRLFYRYVDNYIQGVPATDPLVTALRPDALQFANVDASFYGADAPWGFTINRNWSLDGVVSYVRGKRDDISDDLYRIAPLNGRATLTYQRDEWWASVEGVAYARQHKVSKTNNESKSKSYELLNLNAGTQAYRGVTLTVGIENVFDKNYADHLSGINRVSGTDVPVGERVPGHGRNYLASIQWRYN